MELSEEKVYSHCQQTGSEEDFVILMRRHKESLILFLRSYVQSMEDAEDLMIDAFSEVAARPSRFAMRSSFRTWLFSTGRNLALMHIRKERLKTTSLAEEEEAVSVVSELKLMEEERNREVYLAMERLNPEYRQILTLLYFEEMPYEEIGTIMRKNRKELYNLAERGRKALRTEMQRMGFQYEE